MRNFFFGLLVLYGAYYYVSRQFEFGDTLNYATKNKDKQWAGPVQYYVGLVYYQRSDYPKAQDAFSKMLEQHPTDYHAARALVLLGDAAEFNRDWRGAGDALKRYLDEYPTGKDAELVRGRYDMLKYQHGNEL